MCHYELRSILNFHRLLFFRLESAIQDGRTKLCKKGQDMMTFSDWTEETRRSLNDPFQLIVGRPLITSQQEENAIFYHSDHRTLNCKKPPKQILMKTSTQVLKTGQKKNHKMSENCHALKMRFTNSHSVEKSPENVSFCIFASEASQI